MRASQFIKEGIDSDAVNELDSYIMNNEELYRRRFMPIISNIKRKMKKNVYDHEKAQKLWMYLVDDAAKEYMADLWGALGSELKNSKTLQQVMKWKLLTNWFVKKASKKEEIGKMMSEMIASKESQKMLWSPWFLMKTLLLP